MSSDEPADDDEAPGQVRVIRMRAEDTFDGQDRLMSRAAYDLQVRATAHSVSCGHPGFVPDDYLEHLDGLGIETHLCASPRSTRPTRPGSTTTQDCARIATPPTATSAGTCPALDTATTPTATARAWTRTGGDAVVLGGAEDCFGGDGGKGPGEGVDPCRARPGVRGSGGPRCRCRVRRGPGNGGEPGWPSAGPNATHCAAAQGGNHLGEMADGHDRTAAPVRTSKGAIRSGGGRHEPPPTAECRNCGLARRRFPG